MAIYTVIGVGHKGKYFDINVYRDTIHYITKLSHACYVGGANLTSVDTAAAEMLATAQKFNKAKGKLVRHSVLSFIRDKEPVTAELANEYAQQIIQHYAPEYQIMYAVHNNTENLHIHFVMNMVSLNGMKYAGKKKDYYAFQNHMRRVTNLLVINSNDCSYAL